LYAELGFADSPLRRDGAADQFRKIENKAKLPPVSD